MTEQPYVATVDEVFPLGYDASPGVDEAWHLYCDIVEGLPAVVNEWWESVEITQVEDTDDPQTEVHVDWIANLAEDLACPWAWRGGGAERPVPYQLMCLVSDVAIDTRGHHSNADVMLQFGYHLTVDWPPPMPWHTLGTAYIYCPGTSRQANT